MSAFEIDSLKLEVARLKRELASERAARREAEKPNPEIDRLKRELASERAERKKDKTDSFMPGPDLEKHRLRDALKASKIEMWRLRNVSNQQRDGGPDEPSDAVPET